MSKKSCPVALQVEILIVISPPSSFCSPHLSVTSVVVFLTVLTSPTADAGTLMSEAGRSSITIVANVVLLV